MVVPRPSATRDTVKVVPSAMEMHSLSLNLHVRSTGLGVHTYKYVHMYVRMYVCKSSWVWF